MHKNSSLAKFWRGSRIRPFRVSTSWSHDSESRTGGVAACQTTHTPSKWCRAWIVKRTRALTFWVPVSSQRMATQSLIVPPNWTIRAAVINSAYRRSRTFRWINICRGSRRSSPKLYASCTTTKWGWIIKWSIFSLARCSIRRPMPKAFLTCRQFQNRCHPPSTCLALMETLELSRGSVLIASTLMMKTSLLPNFNTSNQSNTLYWPRKSRIVRKRTMKFVKTNSSCTSWKRHWRLKRRTCSASCPESVSHVKARINHIRVRMPLRQLSEKFIWMLCRKLWMQGRKISTFQRSKAWLKKKKSTSKRCTKRKQIQSIDKQMNNL